MPSRTIVVEATPGRWSVCTSGALGPARLTTDVSLDAYADADSSRHSGCSTGRSALLRFRLVRPTTAH